MLSKSLSPKTSTSFDSLNLIDWLLENCPCMHHPKEIIASQLTEVSSFKKNADEKIKSKLINLEARLQSRMIGDRCEHFNSSLIEKVENGFHGFDSMVATEERLSNLADAREKELNFDQMESNELTKLLIKILDFLLSNTNKVEKHHQELKTKVSKFSNLLHQESYFELTNGSIQNLTEHVENKREFALRNTPDFKKVTSFVLDSKTFESEKEKKESSFLTDAFKKFVKSDMDKENSKNWQGSKQLSKNFFVLSQANVSTDLQIFTCLLKTANEITIEPFRIIKELMKIINDLLKKTDLGETREYKACLRSEEEMIKFIDDFKKKNEQIELGLPLVDLQRGLAELNRASNKIKEWGLRWNDPSKNKFMTLSLELANGSINNKKKK